MQPGKGTGVDRNRRRMKARFIAGFAGCFLAICSLEVALRVYVLSRGWTFNCYVPGITLLQPHARNGYTLARNYRFRSGVLKIRTNDLGLRGPDIEEAKGDKQRVAIIGGSSVFGYLVKDGEEAARLLEVKLNGVGPDVEVINAGVPGYNLIQSLCRYDEVVASLDPDVVILYLGWNDLVYMLKEAPDAEASGFGPCAAGFERFAAHSVAWGFVVHRFLGRTPEFNPPAKSGDEPTSNGIVLFRGQLLKITKRIREAGASLIICSQATLAHPDVVESARPHLGATSADIEKAINRGTWLRNFLADFSKSERIQFLDVYNMISPNSEMLGDAIHLTTEGEKRLADLWANVLIERASEHPDSF